MNGKHNFEEAVQNGLDNGAVALGKKRNIETVLDEYKDSLSTVLNARSDKAIRVEFHDPHGKSYALSEIVASPVKAWADSDEVKSMSLSANVENSPEWIEILRYELDPVHGYPCSIIYGDNNVSCSSEDQLVSCLKQVSLHQGMFLNDKLSKVLTVK